MPERFKVWETVATRRGGQARVDTRINHSRFWLRVELTTTALVARAKQVPYLTSQTFNQNSFEIEGYARGAGDLSLQIRSDGGVMGPRLAGMRRVEAGLVQPMAGVRRLWANDGGLALSWLSERARQLLAVDKPVHVEIKKNRLTISGDWFPATVDALEDLLNLAAELLTERCLALLDDWTRLASALDGQMESARSRSRAAVAVEVGPAPAPFEVGSAPVIRVERPPHTLEVTTEKRVLEGGRGRPRVWTVVRCRRLGAASGTFLLCPDGEPESKLSGTDLHGSVRVGGRPAGLVDALLKRLAPFRGSLGHRVVVHVGAQVEVRWPGVVTDPGTINAGLGAAAALAAMSAQPSGPYR